MTETCSKCGAVLPDDLTCEAVFNELLALEFTDPAFGRVHMLTVACYMIQHGQYSDPALLWIAQALRDFLENEKPIEAIRQQAGKTADQSKRTWKLTRSPKDPQSFIPWSITIVDVAAQAVDAKRYCQRVTEWARATLDEMQPLL